MGSTSYWRPFCYEEQLILTRLRPSPLYVVTIQHFIWKLPLTTCRKGLRRKVVIDCVSSPFLAFYSSGPNEPLRSVQCGYWTQDFRKTAKGRVRGRGLNIPCNLRICYCRKVWVSTVIYSIPRLISRHTPPHGRGTNETWLSEHRVKSQRFGP